MKRKIVSKQVVWCLCVRERETPQRNDRGKKRKNEEERVRQRERGGERRKKRLRECAAGSTYHHHSWQCPSHYLRQHGHNILRRRQILHGHHILRRRQIVFGEIVTIGQADLRFDRLWEPSPRPSPLIHIGMAYPVHSKLQGNGCERSEQLGDKSVLNSFLFHIMSDVCSTSHSPI